MLAKAVVLSLSMMSAELPELQVSPNVTVSGVSSGGFFAVQMHLAHSDIVQGVGVIAGGPWNCSQGSQATAQIECMMNPAKIDVEKLVKQANVDAGRGALAPLDNLDNDSVYIFNSPKDDVVKPDALGKLEEFYASIASGVNIKTESSIAAAHGFPTIDFGNDCEKKGVPWLQRCSFDAAGEVFDHLYKSLNLRTTNLTSTVNRFSQEPYRKGADLMPEGLIYIPKACSDRVRRCRLHVAFHGCQMNLDAVGEVFGLHAGYNEWAEANDIIVLYPQAAKSAKNPMACWDWFGATGVDYANRRGPQIRAIRAMIDRLMSAPAN
ncbi:MAG TPA: PHB depolymerase family esterase [Bdellovibrionales bacterium]|nr:PHB depolymerase family esterase [Bdellovibrionales bacterium]